MSFRLTFAAFAFALVACGPGPAEPSTEQSPEPVAPVAAADSGTSVASDLPCEVARVLAKNCSNCHGATPSNGAPDALVTRADLVKASPRGGSMAERSLARMKDTTVPMPPAYAGARVPAAELAAFESWVNAGLPASAGSD